LCISSGATFTGTISSISSTSKICISGGAKFNGNIDNIPAGAVIYTDATSQFNPQGLYNFAGDITNNGTTNIGTYLSINGTTNITNTGTFNFNSGFNINQPFNIVNSGTFYAASNFQANNAIVTINSSGTFTLNGYTSLVAGTTITNTGTFAATGQQSWSGVTLNNNNGSFTTGSSYNSISNNSVLNNSAYLYMSNLTLSGSSFTNNATGTITFNTTFTLSNNCTYTNNGTTNLKNNFQLDQGSSFINHGNVQMNNGNTYLNTNGIFTNDGYIYVNGQVTIGYSAVVTNKCTIVAVNGFTLGSPNTSNYGYLLVPPDAPAGANTFTIGQDFYNDATGWVQGVDFMHNGGTVKGSGNYYFSGSTTNYQQFGDNSTPAANFYDASPTGSQMFDVGSGSTTNTTKAAITAVDVSTRGGGCNAAVVSQGINTECGAGYSAVATTFIKNGNFSTSITNSTGNTYSSGTGTTYNFSGGSFISQTDYRGTGSTACARTNMGDGNAFAIVTLGAATSYTGSGNCNSANQYTFPGDGTYGVSAQSNFMYIAGNTLAGEEYLAYQQNVTGLTVGKSYTFSFYVSNMRETSANADDPIIRLKTDGTDGATDGTVAYGPSVITEAATQNSAALNGWKRISYNFVATATSMKFKITDAAFSSTGDEWGLTAINITECKIADNDGDGVSDRDDVDDDNDGVLDVNEYGCSGSTQFTWGTSGTPAAQTVGGVTLTPALRNPYALSASLTMSNAQTGNASNDIKFICNPTTKSQYADLSLSFSKSVVNTSFELNGIDARNNGANTWADSIYVFAYRNGNVYTLKTSEYGLGTEVRSTVSNNFSTTSTNNNLALSSNNGRVQISISDPVDSIIIRYYDNNPAQKNAEIYISAISFCVPADTDGDGIPDYLDLDSDNDGIPDVIENYGVDTDGDGKIDGTYSATTGLSTRLTSAGLSVKDFDGDGVANYVDLDSDNDGIPDILEAGGTDSNNDGKVDSFTDANNDGLQDALTGNGALLKSGSDTNNDGTADSWPNANVDRTGYPNPYDLDSDGDGIVDAIEAGFANSVTVSNAVVSGTRTNGWANTVKALTTGTLSLRNTDGRGKPNYLDIDSDDDGITDNIEGQSTGSYILPTDTDSDGDGIADVYEPGKVGTYGGGGITPYDFDGDGMPDYIDTDSDNDGAPDANEASGITGSFITDLTDADSDGLVGQFDVIDVSTLTAGNYYRNVTMSNMGALGTLDGPTPSGSSSKLVRSVEGSDRDWRNAAILPLSILSFTVQYNAPVATLNWTVTSELDVNNYTVEVSTDGISYNSAATVAALNAGNATYQSPYTITDFTKSIYYFRIKQTDKNGKSYYTKVITVSIARTGTATAVHPNPFRSYIQVDYSSNMQQKITMNIYSSEGRMVLKQEETVMKGNNRLLIDRNIDRLTPGIYYLHITTSQNENEIIKIIKINS